MTHTTSQPPASSAVSHRLTHRRTRILLSRSITAVAAAAVLTSLGASAVLTSLGASAVASQKQLRTITSPMVSSTTSSSTAWAVVVMGKIDGHHDLFPELFSTTSTSTRWLLATPPGVADNGGLFFGIGAEASALVGIGTSQALAFSPLAYSASGGRNWIPGGLESGLAKVPSAIALGPRQSAAVLVTRSDQIEALKRTGSLEQWSLLVTTKVLSLAAPSCDPRALSAIAITSSGHYLLGTTCTMPRSIGVFTDIGGRWSATSAQIPAALSGASFETIRLTSTGAGADALFVARTATSTEVVAGWLASTSRSWTLTSGFSLAASSQLVATGAGPGAAQFALIRNGTKLQALLAIRGHSQWQRLDLLPANTQSLAFEPDGRLDALVVHTATLTIWRQAKSGSSFTKAQTIAVPIEYGSSA